MTYQNKKNGVGNTNNTNNFNGICNVSFFQFLLKHLFVTTSYSKYSNMLYGKYIMKQTKIAYS